MESEHNIRKEIQYLDTGIKALEHNIQTVGNTTADHVAYLKMEKARQEGAKQALEWALGINQ